MAKDRPKTFVSNVETNAHRQSTQQIPILVKAGDRLQDYHIHSALGSGGMAHVFKAIHIKSQKTVAIKTLRTQSKKAQDRFMREYKFLSSIHHENLLRAYDFFQQDNRSYMVLEFVQGTSLKDIFESGIKIPLHDQLAIANKIARGIQILNMSGIIHRDIKPDNIMVNLHDGIVKILDLGIGKDINRGHTSNLTIGGEVIGTPMYLSPEQTNGQVTATSDIFSLGIVLHQLFTGSPQSPFEKENVVQCLIAVSEETPPKIKDLIDPTHPDMWIYEKISPVIEKALQKSPQHRWKDAGQIADFIADLHQNYSLGQSHFTLSHIEKQLLTSLQNLQIQDNDIVNNYQSVKKETRRNRRPTGRTRPTARVRTTPNQKNVTPLIGLGIGIVVGCIFFISFFSTKPPERKKTPPKKVIELPMDATLWQACWDKKNSYFDFTHPKWQRIGHKRKQILAQKYQLWYARTKCNLTRVEKDFTLNTKKITMLLIPPGKFWMGSKSIPQIPQRKVILTAPFWISASEFTQQQWCDVMGKDNKPWQGKSMVLNPYNKKTYNIRNHDLHPVSFVSWNLVCAILLKKLNDKYRLPTEAEWEYACRAGSTALFFWGNNGEDIHRYANVYDLTAGRKYFDSATQNLFRTRPGAAQQLRHLRPLPVNDGFVEVTKVKSFQPNAFGVYDILGNVLEWCADSYNEPAVNEVENPRGSPYGPRIARGGSWSGFDYVIFRCEFREQYPANTAKSRIGFRLVKDF
ncbi:bifunctional serine/threonine-protein kinase/formylglycine-generating enzyme family protein [Candidatus Uabimicrobium amorphum]|uniref:Protein kinase n=1 Tax=Uabimicrobium amorphum TaxID=2596890 RepID=A0A5S9IQP6_UABAM|nr:bifunctional serine/threonine-protein kinase/formylglycine-generating enzyme family protein [Candidatus Uabimicrobium amorphum]BBM85821.1 protein kinase [Candidatus Uabimicrobium amorphum]